MLPRLDILVVNQPQLLEALLNVEPVCGRVAPVDVPEETFEFSYFVIANVVPDFID
jgi:hypothetical protein